VADRDPSLPKPHPVFARFFKAMAGYGERAGFWQRRVELLEEATGRVVEVGAGTGLNFRHYPAAVSEVLATEPDPTMLAEARKAAATARMPVTVLRAAAEALPAEDGWADTVVTSLVLCSVTDPGRALAETRRVLKPGGRLLFLEHVRAPQDSRLARWQDRLERPWGFVGGGCHPNRDTLEAIEDAGFVLDHYRAYDEPGPMLLVRPHVIGVARAPAAPVVAAVGPGR
jgi:SAM-dependent methyltransferase